LTIRQVKPGLQTKVKGTKKPADEKSGARSGFAGMALTGQARLVGAQLQFNATTPGGITLGLSGYFSLFDAFPMIYYYRR
jgi:hypothetical protein